MPDVVGVRFKRCGKIYDFEVNGVEIHKGDIVVVESELGLNIGNVVTENYSIEDQEKKLKKIIRKATEEDLMQKEENRGLETEARDNCLERIMARGLPMKLISTEATLDRKRIIFYFTAEKRIDFRELVKDLASKFKTRIEMRQIGVRDGARIIGSLGICGRELCCTKFLTLFEPISIKMAKKQELVLNTGKLSGACGRLMCCLGFEYSEAFSEDAALIEEEALAIPENEEAGEVIVASSDSLAETVEPATQPALFSGGPSKEVQQPIQQPENQEKKDKNKKWHIKKRRRRFHQKKAPQ
ncbi:MAG: regulatory iron-sulfur-containing complex subunit RicT [Thermodesulfovibrionales bacterium]